MENIKKIKSNIWIDDYIIEFSYETKRKNKKVQKRIISHVNEKLATRDFWLWINTFNTDFEYRAMLNVKILSIEKVNGRYIEI